MKARVLATIAAPIIVMPLWLLGLNWLGCIVGVGGAWRCPLPPFQALWAWTSQLVPVAWGIGFLFVPLFLLLDRRGWLNVRSVSAIGIAGGVVGTALIYMAALSAAEAGGMYLKPTLIVLAFGGLMGELGALLFYYIGFRSGRRKDV